MASRDQKQTSLSDGRPGGTGVSTGGPHAAGEPRAGDGGEVAEKEESRAETAREEIERLTRELAAKTEEAEQNHDSFLRSRADLENFKKRMQREKAEALRYAIEPLARDLLPVMDNLERALEHAESDGNGKSLVEGVRLVLKSALDMLSRHGVTRVEAGGQAFDPSHHEAVAQVADANREPNQVVEQFLPGYALHQRLLRAAQVSVSSTPPVEKPQKDD